MDAALLQQLAKDSGITVVSVTSSIVTFLSKDKKCMTIVIPDNATPQTLIKSMEGHITLLNIFVAGPLKSKGLDTPKQELNTYKKKRCGCLEKVKNLVHTGKDLSKAGVAILTQNFVDEKTFNERKSICEMCEEKDSKGDRLYRLDDKGRASCGVPFEDNILREPDKDGCGCYLDVKLRIPDVQCPYKKWPGDK